MKKIGWIAAMAVLGLAAMQAQAELITVSGVNGAVSNGTSSAGTVALTQAPLTRVNAVQTMQYTISGLDLNGIGGTNDNIVIDMNVEAARVDLRVFATGYMSDAGSTCNASGEGVSIWFDSMSVNLDGGTGNGFATFEGINAATFALYASGEKASINGDVYTSAAGTNDVDKHTFAAVDRIDTLYVSGGGWRFGSFDFEIDLASPYEGTVWELDMNTDPVLTNWTARTGSSSYTLTNGVMTMDDETLLDAEPFNELKGLTQIDLQWRSITDGTGSGRGAFLWLNIDRDVPDFYPVRFESIKTLDEQTVQIVANDVVTSHAGFSTNMLTLSATLNAFNETAEYIVTDGALSVTNTVSLVAKEGGGGKAATLGTQGPSAEVEYVRVEANVRPDEALLVASDEIAMELIDPATTVTGSVELAYGTVSTNLEITAITVSDESHAGVFSVLTAAPQTLDSAAYGTTNLVAEFDNSVVGVVGTATGLVTVSWTETGTGVTNDTVVPVSAYYAPTPEPDVTWDARGNGVNWGDAANWDTDEVPGTYDDGSALVGNGATATVATNFTGSFAYDVIVTSSSTLIIAADLQNVGAMNVGTEVGSAATVNQTMGAVASASLNISVASNSASAVYNLSDGSHAVSGNVTVQSNGVLKVDGGALDVAGSLSISSGAVVRQTDGSVIPGSGNGAFDKDLIVFSGGVYEISGGTLRMDSKISCAAGSIFRIIGDEASVSQAQALAGANAGIYEFVLDETGVSTLYNTGKAALENCQFSINGSAYTGGAADIVLYSGTSNAGNTVLGSDYTVTGLGTEGVDWAISESLTPIHTVTLNIFGLVAIGDIAMGGVNEAGDIVFSWDTADGQSYNVETNADLVFPSWGVYTNITGDGAAVLFTNTPALDQLFYKVTSP